MAATQDPLKIQVFKSLKRTHDMFLSEYGKPPPVELESQTLKVKVKISDEYARVKDVVVPAASRPAIAADPAASAGPAKAPSEVADMEIDQGPVRATAAAAGPAKEKNESTVSAIIDGLASNQKTAKAGVVALANKTQSGALAQPGQGGQKGESSALMPRQAPVVPKPKWHAPWKLYRVIAGHTGWVRCLAFDPTNQWFATGGNDRVIKIWDLAAGTLKLSLTGHVSHVRALQVSNRHPYLFSAGEDKQVKCWDLECNKVIRHYHGHLSAVYTLSIHPTLDLIVTGARDSTARVWDMRTKACVHVLSGHQDAVSTVLTQGVNPQVTTTSYDSTVRLWDLAAGKSITTLTNHKKAVRAAAMHPDEFSFVTGSADNIKKWKYPNGDFMMNVDPHKSVINALAVNQENVLVSAGDNGTMNFYDWKTGYNFQKWKAPPQPGSLESESGVFALGFDHSGSRLVTCETDKSIKMYKEDENATEETHPVVWRPDLRRKKF